MEHKHNHHTCTCPHNNVKYCALCNVAYCVDCGKEWVERWTYVWNTYPSNFDTTQGTYFTISCSHNTQEE